MPDTHVATMENVCHKNTVGIVVTVIQGTMVRTAKLMLMSVYEIGRVNILEDVSTSLGPIGKFKRLKSEFDTIYNIEVFLKH